MQELINIELLQVKNKYCTNWHYKMKNVFKIQTKLILNRKYWHAYYAIHWL